MEGLQRTDKVEARPFHREEQEGPQSSLVLDHLVAHQKLGHGTWFSNTHPPDAYKSLLV